MKNRTYRMVWSQYKLVLSIISVSTLAGVLLWALYSSDPNIIPSSDSIPKLNLEKYDQLYQMALLGNPAALSSALKLSQEESPSLRERAANLLGHYEDPEALKALKELIRDKNELVRVQTIHALARGMGPHHKQILIDRIHDNQLSDLEKSHLYSSLFNLTRQSKEDHELKLLSLDHLIYLILNSEDPKAQQISSGSLSQIHYDEPKVTDLFKNQIESQTNPIIQSHMIKYLASIQEPWFKTIAPSLYENNQLDRLTHQSLIEVLHLVCPPRRPEYIRRYLNSTDLALVSAMLAQVHFHNNQDTRKALSYFLANAPSDLKNLTKRRLKELGESRRPDRCAQ